MIALEISDRKFGELNLSNWWTLDRERGGNEEKWRNQVPFFQSVSLVKASCALSLHSNKNSAVLIWKRERGRENKELDYTTIYVHI